MTTDHRITPRLIHDIVNALERHGYYAATTSTPTAPSASSATWPAAAKAPKIIPPTPAPPATTR